MCIIRNADLTDETDNHGWQAHGLFVFYKGKSVIIRPVRQIRVPHLSNLGLEAKC